MLEAKPFEEKPKFFEDYGGSPGVTNTDGLGNLLPIAKVVTHEQKIEDFGATITINHGMKKIYQYFARYKPKGSKEWQMFPTVFEASGTIGGNRAVYVSKYDENNMTIQFDDFPDYSLSQIYIFQIFFVDFRWDD